MNEIKAITNNKENEQVIAAANAPASTTEEKKTTTKDPPDTPAVAVKQGASSSSSDDNDDKNASKDEALPKEEGEEEPIQKDNAVETATASLKDPPKCSSSVVDEKEDNEHDNVKPPPDQSDAAPTKDAPDQEAILHRPIKRARTAYFIFCESKRPAVVEQHKGESVAVVAKTLGQLWNALPEEEKQVFQQKAAAERAQVQAELKARDAAGLLPQAPEAASNKKATDPFALAFPLARIRKIVKLDPEVSVIHKQALAAVTKAAELFVEKLGLETVRVASVQNRRKLLPEDVVMVCETKDAFAFLRDDLQDLVAAQQSTTQEQQQQQQQQQAAGTKRKAAEVASQSNKLTSYFAVKPKDASS